MVYGARLGRRAKPLVLKDLGPSYAWACEYSSPCSCAAVLAARAACVSFYMLPTSSYVYYYTKNPCSQV
jgi:hypothetical protein